MDALRSAAVLLLVTLFMKLPTLRADQACLLPLDTGTCLDGLLRFFFNQSAGACDRFVYGGCEGNANNFETIEACQAACHNQKPCLQPLQTGTCSDALERFFFNQSSETCEEFWYRGCGGNANNFETIEACQDACHNQKPCLQPLQTGTCSDALGRFFFNQSSETCDFFLYGGCEGNANNFETVEACQAACYNPCQQPKDPGPCSSFFPRFFFSSQKGACEGFTYGGCAGNANNFKTLEECQATCPTTTPQP